MPFCRRYLMLAVELILNGSHYKFSLLKGIFKTSGIPIMVPNHTVKTKPCQAYIKSL